MKIYIVVINFGEKPDHVSESEYVQDLLLALSNKVSERGVQDCQLKSESRNFPFLTAFQQEFNTSSTLRSCTDV